MIPAVISNLDIFKVYSAMARHSAESQKVAATNIAHADEPSYKASEIESFQDYLTRTSSTEAAGGEATRFKTFDVETGASPNGNTVNIEQEVFRAVDAVGQHELALTVYTKSLDLLRAALGRKI